MQARALSDLRLPQLYNYFWKEASKTSMGFLVILQNRPCTTEQCHNYKQLINTTSLVVHMAIMVEKSEIYFIELLESDYSNYEMMWCSEGNSVTNHNIAKALIHRTQL